MYKNQELLEQIEQIKAKIKNIKYPFWEPQDEARIEVFKAEIEEAITGFEYAEHVLQNTKGKEFNLSEGIEFPLFRVFNMGIGLRFDAEMDWRFLKKQNAEEILSSMRSGEDAVTHFDDGACINLEYWEGSLRMTHIPAKSGESGYEVNFDKKYLVVLIKVFAETLE